MMEIINVNEWIEENKKFFLPPVCNKLMHNRQLKVFFVGGPNGREDYHVEKGEEFFYMLKGDMVLSIVEQGRRKDIPIREGECFVLPGCVPHSPRRSADSIGLVIERERLETEHDALRYYVHGTTRPLFERWFYCRDLGSQLRPIIEEFFASAERQTQTPTNYSIPGDPRAYADDATRRTMEPVSLSKFLATNREQLLAGARGRSATVALSENNNDFVTDVTLLGQGTHTVRTGNFETWLWQLKSSSTSRTFSSGLGAPAVTPSPQKVGQLGQSDSLLVPKNTEIVLVNSKDAVTLSVSMPCPIMPMAPSR